MKTDKKVNKQAQEEAQRKFREKAEQGAKRLISLVNEVFQAEEKHSIPKLHELANSFPNLNLRERLQEMVKWWTLAGVGPARFLELHNTFDGLAKKAEDQRRPGIGCAGKYLIPDDLLRILRKELRKASDVFLELAATA